MADFLTLRRMIAVGSLTAAWCAMWQTLSVANVVSGLVVAVGVTALGVGTAGQGGIRPAPLAKFIWLVAVDLLRSTVDVAVEIITPTDRTEEAVIAVQHPEAARDHLLLLTVTITLTPGTAVVDADSETGIIYLHVLHHSRSDATTEHVLELAQLACAALPANRDVRSLR